MLQKRLLREIAASPKQQSCTIRLLMVRVCIQAFILNASHIPCEHNALYIGTRHNAAGHIIMHQCDDVLELLPCLLGTRRHHGLGGQVGHGLICCVSKFRLDSMEADTFWARHFIATHCSAVHDDH